MANERVAGIVLSIGICIGVLGSHLSGSLWPWINGTAVVVIFIITLLGINDGDRFWPYAIFLIVVAIYLRLWIGFYPSSLVGLDPDRYAIAMQRLIVFGHLESLEIFFYRDAPAHLLYGSIVGIIMDENAIYVSRVLPGIMGLTLPVLGAAIVNRCVSCEYRRLAILSIIALIAILPYGVRWSYWIIPQTTSLVFLLIFIYSLIALSSYRQKTHSYRIILLISLGLALITHKMVVLVLLMISGIVLILEILLKDNNMPRKETTIITFLSGAVFIYQSFYLTTFGLGTIFHVFSPVSEQMRTPPPTPLASRAVTPTFRFMRLLSTGFLAVFGGLSWLYMFIRSRNNSNHRSLLGVGAAVALLPLAGVIMGIFHPVRGVLYSEAVIATTVVIGISTLLANTSPSRKRIFRGLGVLAISILLISSALSSAIVPDHPSFNRQYLNEDEVVGKEWGGSYANTSIGTDFYTASKLVPSDLDYLTSNGPSIQNSFYPIGVRYLSGNISEEEVPLIAHSSRDIFWTTYYVQRLLYNPESQLDRKRSQIYDNGRFGYWWTSRYNRSCEGDC